MGLSRWQIGLLVLLFAAAAAGGAWFVRDYRRRSEEKTYAAKVGGYLVTVDQLALRQAHANVYYPGSGTPEVALAQLVQGYLSAEIMKQQGVDLDHATWLAEEQRIEQQTRDPATLAKLKFVYGKDHESYLYVGILPDFAQSRLYRLYRSSPALAEEARKTAASFLDAAEKQPAQFAALAKRNYGVEARTLKVDPKQGLQPYAAPGEKKAPEAAAQSEQEARLRAQMTAEAGDRDREAARVLIERLGGLTPGAVYANTLEAPESFETVRLVKREADGSLVVEMAGFAKPDYGAWFWKEAAKIPVHVYNAALREQFVKEVGWARQLNLY
jgi:hypothetical protein